MRILFKALKTILFASFFLDAAVTYAQLNQASLVVQNGHKRELNLMELSPNGKYIATVGHSFDHQDILIWEVESGLIYRRIRNEGGDIEGICFRSDEELLVVSDDKTTKLWNIFKGELLFSIKTQREGEFVAVSSDGEKAVIAKYGLLYWIDAQSGQLIKQYQPNFLFRDLIYSQHKDVVYTTDDSSVIEFNLHTGINKVLYTLPEYCSQLLQNDNVLVASGLGLAVGIDLRTNQKLFEIEIKSWPPHSLLFQRDRVILGQRYQHTFLNEKGEVLKTIDTKKLGLREIIYSKLIRSDSELLLVDDKNNFHIYSFKYEMIIRSILSNELMVVEEVQFDRSNRYLLLNSGGFKGMTRLDLLKGEMQELNSTNKYFPKFTSTEHWHVSANRSEIQIRSRFNEELIHAFPIDNDHFLSKIIVSEDERFIYILNNDEELFKYSIGEQRLIFKLDGDLLEDCNHMDLSPDGSKLALSCSHQKQVKILSAVDGNVLYTINTPKAFTSPPASSNPDSYMGNVPGAFKRSGQWYMPSNSSMNAGNISFVNNDQILVHDHLSSHLWDLNTQKMLKRSKWGNFMYDKIVVGPKAKHAALSRMTRYYGEGSSLEQFSIEVHSLPDLKVKFILQGHSAQITSLTMSPNGKYLVSSSEDGLMKVWDLINGKLLWNISIAGKTDFVISTPENYYFATRAAFRNLGFRMGKHVYPPEVFDLQYHRPDTVMSLLGLASPSEIRPYKEAWMRRLSRSGYSPEVLMSSDHIPSMAIKDQELELTTENRDFELTFSISDSKYGIKTAQVYVNGSPIYGKTGLEYHGLKEAIAHCEFELNNGKNVINWQVTNTKGVKSILGAIEVNYIGEKRKPNLYLLCMSVGMYEDLNYNLKYPVKDARDLANTLKRSRNFNEIFIDTLFDFQASVANFNSRSRALVNSKVDDVVMIFLSGHGLLGKEDEFYFATHDCNFEVPSESALSFSNIEDLLWKINSRKVVLLMDACHSGEVDENFKLEEGSAEISDSVQFAYRGARVKTKTGKSMNSIDFMKQVFVDLNYGSGAQIISAASGEGYALESDEWANGVFTYSIIKGLNDRNADLNSDRKISAGELRTYVQKEVFQLTGGRQQPTSRNENVQFDFEVY